MAPVSVLLSQQDAAEQLRELITKNTITDPTQIIPTISVLPKTDPLLSGTQTRDLYLATQTRYTVQDKLVFVGGAYLDEMITVLQGDKAITGNDLTVMLSGETTVLLVTNTTDHTLRLGQGGTMTFVEPGSLVFIELHKAPVVQGIELRYGKQSLYNETFSRQQPRERGKTGDYPYSFPDNFYQSPDIAVYPGTGYTIGLQATTAGSAGQRSELGLYQIVRSPTTTQEQTDFGLTGEVGALSYEAWTKQLGATEPPKLKVLSYEQRGYLELSGAVELLASGAVSLHLPKAPGSYLLYARDTNGFAYALYLIAEDNFAPTLSDNKDEMTLILTARVPFDQAEVQKQFEQWLGTGKIDVAASDPYGHELQIHYRIPPQTEITKQIDLRSVFGQTTINYITLFVPTIPKQFIKQQIYGGAINLLPAKGYRGSRLEL
ncbi:MAG: hypothetical protein Q8O99_04605 [bacterium]|nr:hypothetical protein [bacterium]